MLEEYNIANPPPATEDEKVLGEFSWDLFEKAEEERERQGRRDRNAALVSDAPTASAAVEARSAIYRNITPLISPRKCGSVSGSFSVEESFLR